MHQRLGRVVRPERWRTPRPSPPSPPEPGPARQRLGQANDVGRDPRLLAGEHRAAAAETGEDLVGDQQQPVLASRGAPHCGENLRRMEPHAARALDQGLDDHRGQLVLPFARAIDRAPLRLRASRGRSAKICFGSQPSKCACMLFLGVAHRHRPQGVAVIALAERQEADAAALPAIQPRLDRHLHRHLDGDRAGVGEEHVVQIGRGSKARQPLRQPLGRFMGKAAEHDVRHGGELAFDGLAGCAGGCIRGRRSTMRRCRRSGPPVPSRIFTPSVATASSGAVAVFIWV